MKKATALKPSQIAAFRLARHHFMDRTPSTVNLVCQDVCGIQAQVMSAAQMALWARIRGLKRADIQSALCEQRTLVKTSAMRQTLHLLPAREFSIYIAAIRSSRLRAVHRLIGKFGISPAELDALNNSIMKALSRGPLPQRELQARVLVRANKKIQKWASLVWSIFRGALAEGLICYAPDEGQEVKLVRVDKWLPKQPKIEEADAQQYILRRFLRAYGPATAHDFARWAGYSVPEARATWNVVRDELAEVESESFKSWVLAEDLEFLKKNDLRDWAIRVLPGFDSYLLAHAEKEHLVAPQFYKRVYRNQGWISPVVLYNGKVAGVWGYQRRGSGINFEVSLFEKFSKPIFSKVEEQFAELAQFLESEWELKFVPAS
jgi:hypothetical protein